MGTTNVLLVKGQTGARCRAATKFLLWRPFSNHLTINESRPTVAFQQDNDDAPYHCAPETLVLPNLVNSNSFARIIEAARASLRKPPFTDAGVGISIR